MQIINYNRRTKKKAENSLRINDRKARITANGLTQEDIADRFGCSQAFISQAIGDLANSEKAIEIREFIDSLDFPQGIQANSCSPDSHTGIIPEILKNATAKEKIFFSRQNFEVENG